MYRVERAILLGGCIGVASALCAFHASAQTTPAATPNAVPTPGASPPSAVDAPASSGTAPIKHLGVSAITYDISRDLSPSMCFARIQREAARRVRTADAIEQLYIARPDTIRMSAEVVDQAMRCSKRWSVQETPVLELPGLLRLSLIAGDTAQAWRAASRWANSVSVRDTVERAERWLQVAQLHVSARPRLAANLLGARKALAELRKLGPSSLRQQLSAQGWLLWDALRDADPLHAAALADSTIHLVLELRTPGERMTVTDILALALMVKSQALFRTPQGKWGAPTLDTVYTAGVQHTVHDIEAFRGVPRGSLTAGTAGVPASVSALMNVKTHPPLTASRWFFRPDNAEVLPRPGVPTIILGVDENCGEACHGMYAEYRRLYALLAPRGVDFILMTSLAGHAHASELLAPEAEMDSIRTYFHDTMRMPGIIGVRVPEYRTLADGRKDVIPDESDPLPPCGVGMGDAALAGMAQGTFIRLVTATGQAFDSGEAVGWGGWIGETLSAQWMQQFLDIQLPKGGT